PLPRTDALCQLCFSSARFLLPVTAVSRLRSLRAHVWPSISGALRIRHALVTHDPRSGPLGSIPVCEPHRLPYGSPLVLPVQLWQLFHFLGLVVRDLLRSRGITRKIHRL